MVLPYSGMCLSAPTLQELKMFILDSPLSKYYSRIIQSLQYLPICPQVEKILSISTVLINYQHSLLKMKQRMSHLSLEWTPTVQKGLHIADPTVCYSFVKIILYQKFRFLGILSTTPMVYQLLTLITILFHTAIRPESPISPPCAPRTTRRTCPVMTPSLPSSTCQTLERPTRVTNIFTHIPSLNKQEWYGPKFLVKNISSLLIMLSQNMNSISQLLNSYH